MTAYGKYIKEDIGLFSGINIVPFTDIILVLLIVFMVSAPGLMRSGLGVQLPQAKNEDHPLPENLNIVLDRTGNIFVNRKRIEIKKLQELLQKKVEARPAMGVTLDADQDINHGQVITILDMLRSA